MRAELLFPYKTFKKMVRTEMERSPWEREGTGRSQGFKGYRRTDRQTHSGH